MGSGNPSVDNFDCARARARYYTIIGNFSAKGKKPGVDTSNLSEFNESNRTTIRFPSFNRREAAEFETTSQASNSATKRRAGNRGAPRKVASRKHNRKLRSAVHVHFLRNLSSQAERDRAPERGHHRRRIPHLSHFVPACVIKLQRVAVYRWLLAWYRRGSACINRADNQPGQATFLCRLKQRRFGKGAVKDQQALTK